MNTDDVLKLGLAAVLVVVGACYARQLFKIGALTKRAAGLLNDPELLDARAQADKNNIKLNMLALKERLTEADYAQYPVWVSIDDSDDFELIEQLGFDMAQVHDFYRTTINGPNEHYFPAPAAAVTMPFSFIRLSAEVTTVDDVKLIAHNDISNVNGTQALSIFYQGEEFRFTNGVLADRNVVEAKKLMDLLQSKKIFPLTVKITATNEVYELVPYGVQV